MKRCVIIGGAPIQNYENIKSCLKENDFNVFCDSGLRHMDALGISPDLIIGDFDSHANPCLPVETIVLPCEKDDTDTVFAVKEALKRGFEEFLLIGVIGGRLDHTLANVSILLMLDKLGKKAEAADDYSVLSIVSDKPVFIKDKCRFFSLLNISGEAKGVCIKNAKYPLENSEISCEYQYGISNEVLPGKTAEVSVKSGRLLLIKVYRE